MNIIYEKFKKVNVDHFVNKAISRMLFDNYAGIFYDKRFDKFFVGDFQTIIKHKGDDNVITLASYCITDFFGSGFVDLKFWQKNKEIEKIYPALKSTMYCDCLDFLKNEANYANAA